MLNWIISMLSAHISSRMLSLFIASYPHGKTHWEANEANWGVKKMQYFPYFFLTGNDGQSQWTNPKLFHSEVQWSSSAQISVCLAELAADIKDYWIFPKPSTVGAFEIWHSWWKVHLETWGECFKCFKSLGWKWIWFYQVTKAFLKQSKKIDLHWNHTKGSLSLWEKHPIKPKTLRLYNIILLNSKTQTI